MSSASVGWDSKGDGKRGQKRARAVSMFGNMGFSRKRGLVKRPSINQHHFRYRISAGTVGIANGANSSYNGINFRLNQIPNYTELTSLYDEYRIDKVVVEFHPRASALTTPAAAPAAGNVNQSFSNIQPFLTVIDYDDSTPPGSRNDLVQYSNLLVSHYGQKVTRTFVPHVAVPVFRTGVSSGYGSKPKQWIDCANDDVPHYGLKWAFNQDTAAGADTVVYDLFVTFHLTMRGVR